MDLYCERVFFNYKRQAYEVVFDFNKMSDLKELAWFLNIEILKESSKTLLILNDVKVESYQGPKAGCWYNIPICFFSDFNIVNEDDENRLIRFNLTMRDNQKLNFRKFRVIDKYLYNDHLYNKHEKTIDFKNSKLYRDMKEIEDIPKLKLIVRDVGCGNWNEVVGDRFRLIYDLGGDIKFSNKEMENIFTRVNLTGPYYAVISHWDLDHYRAVLDLDDAQLALMKNIVVPSKMPNTLQLNKALHRLQSFGITIDIITPAFKSGRGRGVELIFRGGVNNFKFFRSSDGANINQSGIVLTIEGIKKVAVLTGDHHYTQIYNGVLSRKFLKPYEFVVPHHGGNAGNFDLNIWNSIPFASGVLSTKSLRYKNLPQGKIHNFFITKKSFHCTECKASDYVTTL
ncbi:TPA: aldolase [Bacillus thuringiensis]|uniref:aldolase n=2 Tax=Bacillaceae TaxID=186817 RepID=UPI000BF5D3ED|nr:aldolase [Bacillus thuringiensis]PER40865.1 aldolase [Bacillus thuringiensis]HDX9535344.1 aldolase [Bacillus thuringiensis]